MRLSVLVACALIESRPGVPAQVLEEYTLETVAFSGDYPSQAEDPFAQNRLFGTPHLNNAGQVLFSAHWRGGDAQRRSVLKVDGSLIARSGDAVPGFPQIHYALGVDNNFTFRSFNAAGEVFFTGIVAYTNYTVPLRTVIAAAGINLAVGLWKGKAGQVAFHSGVPNDVFFPSLMPPVNRAGVPYSGPGVVYYSMLRGPWISDDGPAYFYGNVSAVEGVPGQAQQLIGILTGGLFANTSLIAHPGAPAPGLGPEATFQSFTPRMAQKTGLLVAESTVSNLVPNSPSIMKKVLYEFKDSVLAPFYIEGDPLPELPPLSEVVGSNYVLRVEILNVDAEGNSALFVHASATNVLHTVALGYWKKTTTGLAKILRFNQNAATPQGPVFFPAPTATSSQRATIADGKLAFTAEFTGLGHATATRGLFRETTNGFQLVAVADQNVSGSSVILNNNFAQLDAQTTLWMNQTNEVAFFASYRTNTPGTATRAVWAQGRDQILRRVIRAGQQIIVGSSNRTIATFGMDTTAPMFNNHGMMVFTAYFQDGTTAIVRAVPPGYHEPPPMGEDFYYTGTLNNNWHAMGANPPTNWEDSEQNPRSQPPGDAEPDQAKVTINAFPGEIIVLDQRPTSIGSLTQSNGLLRLREQLTLGQPSSLHDLRMEAPNGSLTVNADTTIKHDFDWVTGMVKGPGQLTVTNLFVTNATSVRLNTRLVVQSNAVIEGTLIISNTTFRPNSRLIARTGAITNGGGTALVQSSALLRKEGAGEFNIYTPFLAYEAFLRIPPWGIETINGRLRLVGGGDFNGFQTNTVHPNATLALAGLFKAHGEVTQFQGDGSLDLGTLDQDFHLQMLPFAPVVLNMGGHTANFNRGEITGDLGYCTNLGMFVWHGGRIAVGDKLSTTPSNGLFQNLGRFEIDESAGQARRLDGLFRNTGEIEQRGSFDLHGSVTTAGHWMIVRGAGIATNGGIGIITNFGKFRVELNQPGTVNIDATFCNPSRIISLGDAVIGEFAVGRTNAANPLTEVRLNSVQNVSAAILSGGSWQVGPGCSLFFPADIETLDSLTLVELIGGDIPSLKLKKNLGVLRLQDKNYSSPGSLDNNGPLFVKGGSILTVNGTLQNRTVFFDTKLECLAGSQIVVTADLVNESGAQLRNDGQITVNGTATLGGTITGSGQYIFPAPSVGVFSEFVYVGSSPGTLTIVGSTALANTTTLSMELAGPQTNQFDILAVSNKASLDGTLTVNLLDGFRPAPGDTFPVVQAGSITGQFANATNGQRIATIDGYGSVVVNYTPTRVVLSTFQLNPTPPLTLPATLSFPTFEFDGTINLALIGSPGRNYILQTSTNLSNWSAIETNNASFDGSLDFQILPGAGAQRFFRALSL